ncbi:Arm DNA-binding domain-containing protein [Xenorhabdus siamensis]|uniref:Arm DNA-binding domain-containing protein n=1 Tax=Xenorhabdus siamensis TaxID=3136254 RepID=UPI0030F486A8
MFADGEGLSVKAPKGGQLSWIFAYRHSGRVSRLERLTLGRYPDISLKVARENASSVLFSSYYLTCG